jgi:hypothetical protein
MEEQGEFEEGFGDLDVAVVTRSTSSVRSWWARSMSVAAVSGWVKARVKASWAWDAVFFGFGAGGRLSGSSHLPPTVVEGCGGPCSPWSGCDGRKSLD